MKPIDVPARIACSFGARARGLLGHPPPSAGTGLLLPHCNSIHMLGMRYSIDVVFIDNEGTVVTVHSHARPWRTFAKCKSATHTLETADGEAERMGIAPGSRIRLIALLQPA